MRKECVECILETIREIPNQDYMRDFCPTLDAPTIQLVLDVLDQKLGIS